jgi:hypothetical protein
MYSNAIAETKAIMELKAGLKVYIEDDLLATDSSDRLRINEGVIEIDPDLYPQYSHPAFIPTLPWRSLTDAETELILVRNNFSFNLSDISQSLGETLNMAAQSPPAKFSLIANTIVPALKFKHIFYKPMRSTAILIVWD